MRYLLGKGLTVGLIAATLLASGCNSSRIGLPGARGATNAPTGPTEWLCEAGKAADDWDCIQSEDIGPRLEKNAARARADKAKQETTQQVAEPQQETASGDNPALQPTPAGTPVLPGVPGIPTPTGAPSGQPTGPDLPNPTPPRSAVTGPKQSSLAPVSSAVPTPIHPAKALRTAAAEEPQARTQEPAYAKFAYRPDEPVRIVDLPENFYAAQLLAVSTKEQIEEFVVTQDLYNMSAARIERDGQILYVLLLGVYESKEIAQQAVAAMPDGVSKLQPWIRSIDGLQDAMSRADRLAATAAIRR